MKILLVFLLCLIVFNHVYAHDVTSNKVKIEKVATVQTRAEKLKQLLAQHKNEQSKGTRFKHLNAKVIELKDSTGLVYVGASVNKVELSGYLEQMKHLLGEEQFLLFRANQVARDQHGFHVTLINPYEYQVLTKKVKFGQNIRLTLNGLGKVVINNADLPQKNAQSYFIVTSSADGQYFRQQYLLKPKDFHITLGFNPHDIYTLSKGIERLVK